MQADARSGFHVNSERLYLSLEALGRVGAYYDERLELHGVNRPALTPADGEGRRLVVSWMQELGLTVRVDQIGNVFARRAGREDHLAPVMTGSHIDSVPTGGRFDGCLGVLSGLEVMRTLDENGVVTRRPIEVAFFTEEEGARFGTDMLGSAVATGRIGLEDAYAMRDRDGKSLREELVAIDFLGEAPVGLVGADAPHAYVELHIEQGPILRWQEMDIGVVAGVQGICWHELSIRGRSAHAGTTPIALRRDAGVAAARINVELRRMIASGAYGQLLATMGLVRNEPGWTNVVPGRCQATVDLRNPAEEALLAAERDLVAFYEQVAREEGVSIDWRQTVRTETVAFDGRVQTRIADAAERRGLRYQVIVSGAGHDAQEIARVCPAAMIFVPGEHDGISHNPRELSTQAQCERGADVLLDVLLELAEQLPA